MNFGGSILFQFLLCKYKMRDVRAILAFQTALHFVSGAASFQRLSLKVHEEKAVSVQCLNVEFYNQIRKRLPHVM